MAKALADRLAERLIERKLVSADQVKALKDEARHSGKALARVLVEQGVVSEDVMLGLIAQEFHIPPIHLNKIRLDRETVRMIPEALAQRSGVVAISKLGERLTVAMANPLDVVAIDEIQRITHCEVNPLLAPEAEIRQVIQHAYGQGPEVISEMVQSVEVPEEIEEQLGTVAREEIDLAKVVQESGESPMVRMIDLILAEALQRRASDIHLEPQSGELRVRFRVDGNLQEAFAIPKAHQNAVIARLKILSRLDITETRLPQDGRFKAQINAKEVDFRVSVLPILYGGKVVLRVLEQSSLKLSLDQLGVPEGVVKAFQEAIAKPYGMILISGPTGSGKSTTLYAMINQLNQESRNIVTVEDPVEYQIEGITQTQVQPEIGLTFAAGLRAILRQTPDVVLVGEIRDSETADIAVKASLTGHLMLSTLHTNDAPGAVTRLIDMGVEPFLISSSLILVAAQRLCRRLCEKCKVPTTVPASIWQELGMKGVAPHEVFEAKGCRHCNQTGYYGRLAIVEPMVLEANMRELILKAPSSSEIKAVAIKQGMRTLREDAVDKWRHGLITVDEVFRVTAEE